MAVPQPIHQHCGARTRLGHPCTRPAGWGTQHVGVGRCKMHGGASPHAEVNGQVQLARREYAVMGIPLNVQPHEALLECIRIAAGEVAYASDRIAGLLPEEAVGPTISTRPLKWEKGAESPEARVHEEGPPALHIWIQVRHQALDRLAQYSATALKAGIEARLVDIAERQGEALVEVIRGVLLELGLLDRPDVPAIVRRQLTLVAGQAA